ncbi:MAG: hypothetical protein WCX17_02965 [Parcubacteria group bacterium]|jgi:hypothetical protein
MKAPILSGDQILFFLRTKTLGINEKPYPVIATVLRVCRGALVVAEADSRNGLAEIVCHQSSENDGTYWYEYVNQKGKGCSFNVAHLQLFNDLDDEKTVTKSFIFE